LIAVKGAGAENPGAGSGEGLAEGGRQAVFFTNREGREER